MRAGLGWTARLVAFAALAATAAAPAHAACKVFAFSVTDFGKDGPTKDAKDLLDKYIAEWARERGISNFKVGPKTVKCELYLNLVVVDEHTCKANANVCWEGDAVPKVKAPAKK
jgi:hypothetical protein